MSNYTLNGQKNDTAITLIKPITRQFKFVLKNRGRANGEFNTCKLRRGLFIEIKVTLGFLLPVGLLDLLVLASAVKHKKLGAYSQHFIFCVTYQ